MASVSVTRTTVAAGHKTATTVATGIVCDIQAMTPDAVAREAVPGEPAPPLLYNQYTIMTTDPATGLETLPKPDIRIGDHLTDGTTNVMTGQPTVYLVTGVVDWQAYLQIRAQEQAQASQTGG